MSETGSAFSARTMLFVILAAIVGFAAFLLLAAYAPNISTGRDGRAHGLSTSAVGFRGLYELLDATGTEVDYLRSEALPAEPGLLIVTLEPGSDPERVDMVIDRHPGPVLLILPKWQTVPVQGERDRVQWVNVGIGRGAVELFRDWGTIGVAASRERTGATLRAPFSNSAQFRAPAQLQVITGLDDDYPLLATWSGEAVLGSLYDNEIYVLSDPDFLNNQALADPERAVAALALVDALNTSGGPVRFELVANGFGGARNMLTLAFEPPFLALTLCLLAAALLAGWQAACRFGPARLQPRPIAFGKRALVDNSAQLLRAAGREHLSSERYVAMTREAAIAAIGNPRRLEGEALDAWLDGLGPRSSPPFSQLARAAERADNRHDMTAAARALYQWRKAVTHEG